MTVEFKDAGEYWVLYHPELGFLTFGSYTKAATAHENPNPRGFFTQERQFKNRLIEPFWVKSERYSGNDIIPKLIKIQWSET